METWVKISSLLCIFGFLKEFRPSEPYITPYLMSPQINFTETQISQDIYPVATYANMLSLILVLLVTDFLRYKIIIIADAICGVCVYFGLIFFKSVFAIQVVEVLYGLFMAGEVAYYTYIYAKVDTEHFQEVTSHTRSAYLAGRALSGIVSQAIVYWNLLSYYHLLYLTLAGLICASIWAVFLPSVNQSVYFHQKNVNQSSATLNKESDSQTEESNKAVHSGTNPPCPVISPQSQCKVEKRVPLKQAVQHLWSDFIAAFTDPYVLKWALWWALSTCGYWQVVNYTQLLWQAIRKDNGNFEPPFYGIVEAAYTLLGAMASMTVGKVQLEWAVVGEPLLAVCSVVVAGVLYLSSATLSIVLAYSTYIAFTVIYHTMITVANSEVAKHVNRDSYGLVFGVTTFIALLLQTGLTYVVNSILRLPPRTQFVVYGGYFAVLGACFLLVTLVRIIKRTRRRHTF